MTALWSIEPIALHRFRSPGPEVLFQRAFGEMIDMMIYAFFLRNGDDSILIDTGLPADHSVLNESVIARKGPGAGFFPVGSGIADELAARPASPRLVIVTSFGPYAVGGLDRVDAPSVIVSKRGIEDLKCPEEEAISHPLPTEIVDRLLGGRAIEGCAEVAPGVTFVETGVHHPASAAVIIDTKDGRIAIADPVFTADNLVGGIALGAAEHSAGWHRMVRMLGNGADAILPIHDINPRPVPRDKWHAGIQSDRIQ